MCSRSATSLCSPGHIGRWGSGLVPLRGQNNVQGGGDMGALPNKFPGFQTVGDPEAQAKFEAAYGMDLNPDPGLHLTLMFEAMDEGTIKGAYVIGENPADSEADVEHARRLLAGPRHPRRAGHLHDPHRGAGRRGSSCFGGRGPKADGTVTSSASAGCNGCRAAVTPPGEARHDHDIVAAIARRMGFDWGEPTAEQLWDELRSLSPMHAGMGYSRLESEGGLQWPCPTDGHPGSPFLHGWLHEGDLGGREPAPFSVVEHEGPREVLTRRFPLRLTTGRALDSFNTGVQSGGYDSPIRYGQAIDVNPADAARLGVVDGERVLVCSARGEVEMDVRLQLDIPEGLTFTTFHFPELVDANVLTNSEWDPRSGTAEFKAAAIRIDKLSTAATSG